MSPTSKRLLIGLAVIIVVAGGWLCYRQYGIIQGQLMLQRQLKVADTTHQVAQGLVHPADFASGSASARAAVFTRLFNAVQSPDLARMKVWDTNYTIIWSNLPEIIGQRFTDNEELGDAYRGVIGGGIEAAKDEQVSERQYGDLMEAYVPFADSTGRVVGVVESYVSYEPIKQQIDLAWARFTGVIILVSGALFALCWVSIRLLTHRR